MRTDTVSLLLTLAALIAVPNPSYGCTIIPGPRVAPPKPGSVRIVAVITGYGVVTRPVSHLESAPTLLVRVQEVVDGGIHVGDAAIAFLFYGPDCQSTPFQRTELERWFPIGTSVVALGVDASVRSEGRPTALAELNKGGYVARIPQGVPRTRYGDLDFQRFDAAPSRSGEFVGFEFDRVIVTLSKSSVTERISRLSNLAYWLGFPGMPNAREFYAQLRSEEHTSELQSLRH